MSWTKKCLTPSTFSASVKYVQTVCIKSAGKESIDGGNTMIMSDAVRYHLREVLRAALAEAKGDSVLSRSLNAETKMRLISMSEEDLWELARVTCPPHKTFEQVYMSFREVIDELKTSREWMKDLQSYNDE